MYLRFENEPELEFEYFLAEKLRMTVAELRLMDCYEFLGWVKYYQRKAQRQELERGMLK